MKRTVIFAVATGLAACIFFTSRPAMSAAPEIRVGLVDLQRVLKGSQIGRDAEKKYEVEVKRAQAKVDDKKSELQKLQQSYEKQKETLNPKARAEKEEQLLSLEKELKRSFQDSQEALRRKNGQMVGELMQRFKRVVDDFGRSQGYTMILERSGQAVLFADNQIDVTEDLIKRFDAAR